MPELFEHFRDIAHGGRNLGIDRRAGRGAVGEGNAQATGLAAHFVREGARVRGRVIGADEFRPLCRVEHRGAVAHADRDDMADREAAPPFATIRAHGRSRARRLEAEDATGGRGNADRAAAVRRMRHGQNSRSDRRSRAARGAAGGMLGVPGIARRPVQTRLRRRHQTPFGRRRLAVDHESGVDETLRQRIRVVGDIILVERGAESRTRAREQVEILQQKRHAAERAVWQTLRDLLAREIVMFDHDRVELRIDLLRARDRLVEQFLRARLTAAHQFRETDGVIGAEFLEAHCASPSCDRLVAKFSRRQPATSGQVRSTRAAKPLDYRPQSSALPRGDAARCRRRRGNRAAFAGP